jgi:uncharacterized protein (TIGR00251 family)
LPGYPALDDPAFLRRTDGGVTVELRARPGARRNALDCGDGKALSAVVTAPAEDGKANKAVIELLAATWRMPKSAFEIARGAANRDKVFSIAGEPAELAGRIASWVREQARFHG